MGLKMKVNKMASTTGIKNAFARARAATTKTMPAHVTKTLSQPSEETGNCTETSPEQIHPARGEPDVNLPALPNPAQQTRTWPSEAATSLREEFVNSLATA